MNKLLPVLIQGADALGNPVATAFASSLVATVTPSGPSATSSDVAPGLVKLSFSSAATGSFDVAVEIGGVSVKAAPLTINVVASLTPAPTQTLTWGSFVDGPLQHRSIAMLSQRVCLSAAELTALAPVRRIHRPAAPSPLTTSPFDNYQLATMQAGPKRASSTTSTCSCVTQQGTELPPSTIQPGAASTSPASKTASQSIRTRGQTTTSSARTRTRSL